MGNNLVLPKSKGDMATVQNLEDFAKFLRLQTR